MKNTSISSYSVLIQLIQFSISTDFVYTQLHVKTVPCQTIQSKTFLFQAIQFNQTIQFSINMPLVLFNLWIGPY